MAFYVVEVDNDGFKVYDSAGNLIDPAKDSSVTALGTVLAAIKDTDGIKKIVDALPAGTNVLGKVDQGSAGISLWKVDGSGVVQPISATALPLPTGAATEATLLLIKSKTDNIPADPAREGGNLATLAGKDFATQTTLAALLSAFNAEDFATQTTLASLLSAFNAEDFATETTLASIKNVDGIKKITDQLPAGTNEIGKVAQGTKAAGSGAWSQVLYDASGNAVGVVLDGAVYRLQADAKIAHGTSALVHLDALDTVTGRGRLKTTLYTQDGDAVAFGSVPPNPASIRNAFVLNGTSEILLVDGSGTPVVFSYLADATYDISVQEIKFVLAASSITFGTGYFGSRNSVLPNGVLVEITSGGNTGTIGVLYRNESFVRFASPGSFDYHVSSRDMVYSGYVLGGGLRLKAGTSDAIKVTVRDNLSSAGLYFTCFVKGNLLATT